jgi:centromere protein S
MEGRNFDDADFERLKASFHFTTGKICEERAKELHLEVDKKVIACISNLGLQQLKIFSSDLESFARHAKRTTVNADDVKLLARRNPKLLTHLFTLENKTGKSSRAEPAKKQQPSVKDFTESSAKKVVHSNASSSKATETANSSEMATGKGNKQNNSRKRKNCTTNNTEPFIV